MAVDKNDVKLTNDGKALWESMSLGARIKMLVIIHYMCAAPPHIIQVFEYLSAVYQDVDELPADTFVRDAGLLRIKVDSCARRALVGNSLGI